MYCASVQYAGAGAHRLDENRHEYCLPLPLWQSALLAPRFQLLWHRGRQLEQKQVSVECVLCERAVCRCWSGAHLQEGQVLYGWGSPDCLPDFAQKLSCIVSIT